MQFGIGYFPTHDAVSPGSLARLRPQAPVLVGGLGPTVLDRVLRFGDAWFPNYGPDDLLDRVQELRRRADRNMPVMAIGVPADPGALEPLVEAGFARVLHWTPSGSGAVVEAALERWETAIVQLNGEA